MRTIQKNQKLTIITLALALGVAVYLNWEYAKADNAAVVETAGTETAQAAEQTGAAVTDNLLPVSENTGDKNYGEAQLVSVSKDNSNEFFEQARLDRTKSRDEALDTLKKSLKNADLNEEEKKSLTAQLSAQLDSITSESEMESLIKAKGFVDSVVFVDGDKVHVTVMTANDSLTAEEAAQIQDIVLSHCAVSAQNITIVEVK